MRFRHPFPHMCNVCRSWLYPLPPLPGCGSTLHTGNCNLVVESGWLWPFDWKSLTRLIGTCQRVPWVFILPSLAHLSTPYRLTFGLQRLLLDLATSWPDKFGFIWTFCPYSMHQSPVIYFLAGLSGKRGSRSLPNWCVLWLEKDSATYYLQRLFLVSRFPLPKFQLHIWSFPFWCS